MARRADLFLHPKPSTDLFWLNAISRYLLDNKLAHTKFLDQWVNGLDEYQKSLKPFTMEAAARVSGVPEETLKTVAHMIADAKAMCVLWAMGVTQHTQGSDTSTAISNLLLVTAITCGLERRLSASRPQQCAGSQRPRVHAKLVAGLSICE
jgi:formate dehydrogenase major subunit